MPFDERGAARVAGARCDVGAFEYDNVVPVVDVIFRYGFEGGMGCAGFHASRSARWSFDRDGHRR